MAIDVSTFTWSEAFSLTWGQAHGLVYDPTYDPTSRFVEALASYAPYFKGSTYDGVEKTGVYAGGLKKGASL